MKKLLLIASTAFLAQQASAQFSIAPEVGFQMSKFDVKSAGTKFNGSFKPGFRIGANADLGITQNIHIQAGVFYSAKNSELSDINQKLHVNYLEVPVYVNYMTGEEGGNRFFVGIGPYLGLALSGTAKMGGISSDMKIGTDAAKDDLKPLDLGANINVGYLLSNGFYARAQYGMGFANLQPGGNSDNSFKTSGFGISVGYRFTF